MAGLDQIRHHLPAADRLEGEEGNSRPLGPPAATPHTPPRATQAPLPTDSAHFESMARTQFYAHCKVSSLRIKRALCGPKRKTAGDMAREEASTDFRTAGDMAREEASTDFTLRFCCSYKLEAKLSAKWLRVTASRG